MITDKGSLSIWGSSNGNKLKHPFLFCLFKNWCENTIITPPATPGGAPRTHPTRVAYPVHDSPPKWSIPDFQARSKECVEYLIRGSMFQ